MDRQQLSLEASPELNDPLSGLICPACAGNTLYQPTNGYSACLCSRCGAEVALHAVIAPGVAGGLEVTVRGVRQHAQRSMPYNGGTAA